MTKLAARGAIAFCIPVIIVFALSALHSESFYYVAAAPLSGIIGGLALTRRWGFPVVLGLCFATIGFMFVLEDAHSAWFSDVIWTGLVTGFLFWVSGACAVLTLPAGKRFNAAAAMVIPGAIAGMAFQFLYGPAYFLLETSSRKWWTAIHGEHLLLWLIAGAGTGWALASNWRRQSSFAEPAAGSERNHWAIASILTAVLGLGIGAFYFMQSALPLGLFNSLSPASAAADWLWGWGVLTAALGTIALLRPARRIWSVAGLALAITLVVASYRAEARHYKLPFNSHYAEKLLRENGGSGDAIYAGNLILASTALDNNDVANAKHYLLQAATTPGTRRIDENGLDVSVARVLFDRGEKDAVLEYLERGRTLWPKGEQLIQRWEAAIRAGRRPNFNTRGPGGLGQDR